MKNQFCSAQQQVTILKKSNFELTFTFPFTLFSIFLFPLYTLPQSNYLRLSLQLILFFSLITSNRAIRFIRPPALLYGPRPSAPGPHVLLVFMTFLQTQSMLPDLLFHPLCECSCFELSSLVEKFISVSSTLLRSLSFSYDQEILMKKTQLRVGETFVTKKLPCSVDPYKNQDP